MFNNSDIVLVHGMRIDVSFATEIIFQWYSAAKLRLLDASDNSVVATINPEDGDSTIDVDGVDTLIVDGPISLPARVTYTNLVADLPAASAANAGKIVWCPDALNASQTTGNGTGNYAMSNGTAWVRMDTGAAIGA